jgi:hypothetical protein
MSVTIDLYEFQKALCRYDEDQMDWLTGLPGKWAVLADLEDPDMPLEIRKALNEAGYSDDEVALLIIQ